MIKKELGVYLCVPVKKNWKTDFGRFGEHPTVVRLPAVIRRKNLENSQKTLFWERHRASFTP